MALTVERYDQYSRRAETLIALAVSSVPPVSTSDDDLARWKQEIVTVARVIDTAIAEFVKFVNERTLTGLIDRVDNPYVSNGRKLGLAKVQIRSDYGKDEYGHQDSLWVDITNENGILLAKHAQELVNQRVRYTVATKVEMDGAVPRMKSATEIATRPYLLRLESL
jgi:hypothetical protein